MMRSRLLRRHFGSFDFARTIGGGRTDAICLLDTDGRVMFLNGAAERLLGWTEDDLLGKSLHGAIHRCSDERQGLRDQCPLKRAMEGDRLFGREDTVVQHKDGSELPVTYMVSPVIVDGKCAGIAATFAGVGKREGELQSLRESRDRYRDLVHASDDAMWLTDPYGYITMVTPRAAEMLGFPTWGQMLGMNCLELVALDDRTQAVRDKRLATAERIRGCEYTLVRHSGSERTLRASVNITPVQGEDGRLQGLVYIARELESRKDYVVDELLPKQPTLEEGVMAVLTGSSGPADAIPLLLESLCMGGNWDAGLYWRLDEAGNVLRCVTVWRKEDVELRGFETISRQLSCEPGIDLPGRVWQTGEAIWVPDIMADTEILRSLMASREGLQTAFCFPIITMGELHGVVELVSHAARPEDQAMMDAARRAAIQIGRTFERSAKEQSLRHQATHDALTGLPNRILLQDRMQRAIFVARETGKPLALFLIDLDRFKEVNDTLGHRYGDLLLQQVSQRLQSVLRDSDTVARLGGDEFAVLLPATPLGGAAVVARKILERLREPVTVDGKALSIDGSIGIALYPDHGEEVASLMHAADITMYEAKRARRGYAIYDPSGDDTEPGSMAETSITR